MAAHDWPQKMRQHHERGNIKPRLPLGFVADFTCAFNHHDSFQAGPVMAFSQPFDIVDNGGGSGFDPAVIRIDRGRLTDL
jgi:hypothetical protein